MLQEEPQQMIFKFLFLFGWCMLSQRFANVRKFRWPFRHFAWFLQRYFVVVSRWNTAHKHTTCPSLPPSCSHEAGMRIARKMAKMIFFEILFFWEFASKCMIFANVQKSCKKWPLFGLSRDGAWEWLGGGTSVPNLIPHLENSFLGGGARLIPWRQAFECSNGRLNGLWQNLLLGLSLSPEVCEGCVFFWLNCHKQCRLSKQHLVAEFRTELASPPTGFGRWFCPWERALVVVCTWLLDRWFCFK